MHFSRYLRNAAAVVAITVALGAPAWAAAPSGITSPKDAFGHDIGDDYFLANYTQLEAYFKTLAGQSDRMKLVDIGPTEEGRREYMAIVSSPANLAKLDRYREIARKLAKAEGVSEEEAKALAAEGKAVIWIDGGLHATEVVPPQALIAALHDMLTKDDAETRRILDDVIILFGQVNPDGQELVSNWYMRNADPAKREFNSLPRLYQKYIGHDNNRDYYMSAMKETTNVNRIFFREWYPQIVYNHHQTGPAGTVVFMPPFRDPFNYNYDPLVMSTLSEVGSAMHSRLISEGKPGSTMRSGATYSTWNNGMERSITYFHNTVGLLTEIIGHPTPMQIPLIPKNQIARNDLPAPIAPQQWKFRQSIDYSMSINRAVLDYASRNRERLLMNIWRMGDNSIERGRQDSWTVTPKRIEALEAAAKGRPEVGSGRNASVDPTLYNQILRDPALRDARGYIIPADQADLPTAVKFLNALIKTGVDVERADKAFKVGGKSYPAGSYVVRADQAYRPHVLDMFEPQDHPHDFAYPGGPPIAPYDSTGYTLAMQMGVKFDRILDGFDGPFTPVADVMAPSPGKIIGSGKAGYLVSHEVNDSFILSNRLLKAGEGVYWVKTATKAGGKAFAPGALWIPATPANRAILEKATAELGVDAYAVAKAPIGETLKLKPVRVGLVDKYGGVMTSGWTRWLMEQFEFDYQVVYPQRLDAGDIAKDFDVLVFTNGVLPSVGGEGYGGRQPKAEDIPAEFRGWLGEITPEKTAPQIAAFLQGGGSVVAIGPSTRLAQLVGVPVGDALVDAAGKPLARNDFYIPGSLLQVSVDNTQPLAFGAPSTMDVFFDRSPAFAAGAGARAAWYPQGDVLRSGWAVGQHRLVGAGAVLDLNVGKGKLFLMGPEVAQRAQSHAAFKFLFNGLQYGPAIAATQ
ncbi:M14 metallopeptidase family protein [Phenylobacterium sp.]|uniref:M14 family metallopeptidase n=1 Tax=Phenylobacterium sp. TaxID=1871053 RepID=UPI00273186BC|nr:M14 metallopeptidase family protein [Phenylobacterium sp.]MDP1599250.1 M14 family metallopeptidase [Phenylobacterium sp.]MDP3591018.1 M14 family metallopeptidase [Phenylobacterium sp.]